MSSLGESLCVHNDILYNKKGKIIQQEHFDKDNQVTYISLHLPIVI